MQTRVEPAKRGPRAKTAPLRVLIVDDHPIVREGLRHLINGEADMRVCGECGDASGTLDLVRRDPPEVAVVDLSLGRDSGLELVRTLATQHPDTRLLVLSMHDELLYAERALRAGAHGYVMKRGAMSDLLTAIRRVAGGKTYVSADVAERLVSRVSGRRAAAGSLDPAQALSNREQQVLELIGRGLATREIAAQLSVSVKTIESHQARIKEKLGLRTGRELIRFAVNWTES